MTGSNNYKADVVFAPQTLDQARLFGGIGLMLERRGVRCLFAVPSCSIAESLAHEWGPFVRDASNFHAPLDNVDSGERCATIGAYDVWRGRMTEGQRSEAARTYLSFWDALLAHEPPQAIVVWNGRDHAFVESAVAAAKEQNCRVLYMELGPLRRDPMTVAVAEGGVNAAARFRRPDMLDKPLTPLEAERLRTAKQRFRAHIKPHKSRTPYVFFPLQVDDDTQLYYYAPHFADSKAMVRAVAAAMPSDVQLMVKVHPLADARHGTAAYAPLIREQDRIASPATDTLALIAGASAVVTNNSSAGVEALMLNRPVVVLGDAQYARRGFTFDHAENACLSDLIADAVKDKRPVSSDPLRARYLYELLHHELVEISGHPLNIQLPAEDAERLAVRLWDFVSPDRLGSDWLPVFRQMQEMRDEVSAAVQSLRTGVGQDALFVVSRMAASCLDAPSGVQSVVLEEMASGELREAAGREVFLLAPELNPAQRAEVASRLASGGATRVHDLASALSEVANHTSVKRFNSLPRRMRDDLYATSDYWDYYLTQTGLSPENTPQKVTQANVVAERLNAINPRSVLEYGCGDGRILERIVSDAPVRLRHAVGVDSSNRMLQLARHRLGGAGNVRLLPADARRELPFGENEFECALTCGALQHVTAGDLPHVLSEIHRTTCNTVMHWEVHERHAPTPGEHYTNPATSLVIHGETLRRFGPVEATAEDVQPMTGQSSLLATYRLNRPLLTVLTLHAVGKCDPACESIDYRNLFVSQDQLRELIEGMLEAGWSFTSLREAQAFAGSGSALPRRTAVLTFDDGYASVFEAALPILSEYGVSAAAFIPANYVGKSFGGNARDGSGPALAMMTEEQIRELHRAGWDIGAHSFSHPCFAGLTDGEARREIIESRARIESIVGSPVTAFAFPYGEPQIGYREEHVDMARDAGFELAMTMRAGFVSAGCTGIDWPRIGIGCDTTAESLLARIEAVHRFQMGWPAGESKLSRSLQDRVRSVVRECIDRNVKRIALYGAGRHTAKLLQTAPLLPLDVLGILDDDPMLRGDRRYGLPVYAPSDVATLSPDAVLISSDQYEDAIYQRIAPLEAGGISVLRLYADA